MVFLGIQGICTKVEIFMVLVRVITKRGGDQLGSQSPPRMGENKDIDSRSEYAHSEKSPNSSLTYILH